MSAPQAVYPFRRATSPIVVGYVAPPNESDVADEPMLALPGIRVGRAGMEKFHEVTLRGRAGAVQLEVNAVGRVIRELDRQEGTPRPRCRPDARYRAAAVRIPPPGRGERLAVVLDCRNGEVMAMATNPSFDPSLFNSGVSQAQWAEWTHNRRAPLINKALGGSLRAGLHVQDVHGAGRAEGRHDHARRTHKLSRLSRSRRHAVSLLEQERAWRARSARRAEEHLRRVLLRSGPAHRHRPDRRDGPSPWHGRRTRPSICRARAPA